eukprot:TRINITY_DN23014_c0_g2_i1.p1 TRINITY_DN23014_c0_g2~~TRINITY_DN23014_c0_g2_i1.p1  ORF type:complete len:256 (+),score=37.58 TRINITY_DN23014_c0_g2_i1:379-1146(+)
MVQVAVSCLFGAEADYDAHAIFLEGSIASSPSYVHHQEKLPEPRVLKTHVPADMHPGLVQGSETILKEHGKVIYVVRNPKDALVSLRHHHANNASIGWNGSWDEWVDAWLAGKRSAEYGGSYFKHVKGWWRLARANPSRVRIVYFEDLKENPLREISAVAEFLGQTISEEHLQNICERCSFATMKSKHRVDADIVGRVNPTHFRRGEVGSWREVLTEEQAKRVDEATFRELRRELSEGLRISDFSGFSDKSKGSD